MSNTVTPTDQTATQPWGDIAPSTAEPVHYWTAIGMVACTTAIDTEVATSVAEAVTCAHCLTAMNAPITEDHGPVPAPEPDLSTPEGRWAYLLTVWHTYNLPTPESISVDDSVSINVWLPQNERGHVDRWLAALGGKPAAMYSMNRPNGEPNRMAHYASITDGRIHVSCYMDLTADAEAHGGPVVRTDLAAAADRVVTMLTSATIEDAADAALAWLNAQPVNAALFNAILDQPWCSSVTEPAGGLPDDVELVDGRRLVRTDNGWQLATSDGVR